MTSRRQRIVPRNLPSGPQPRFWSRFFEELRVQLWVHLCLLFIFCLLSLVTTAQNQQKTTNELLHSSDAEQRRDAVLQLGASGKQEAIPFLIDVTQHDSSPEIRAIAASELGRMRATAALEVLTAALQDKDIFVRRTAAYSLGSIGDPTAAPALIRSLSDKEPAVRSAAAYSLGRIGNQTAVGPLINSLADKDDFVRARAACSLGELKSVQAVAPLVSLLTRDLDAEVRRQAVQALGKIGTPEAKNALEMAQTDNDMFVRRYAWEALHPDRP